MALVTGVWGENLPRPGESPAGRHTDAAPPTATELLTLVRDRAVAALQGGPEPRDPAELELSCEIALRPAVSYALVPAPELSARTPTAGGRSHR